MSSLGIDFDVDDERVEDDRNKFVLIDEQEEDLEYPKMVETTDNIVKDDENHDIDDDNKTNKVHKRDGFEAAGPCKMMMIELDDDTSLTTVEREQRRMDKHTEVHELREVFCHSPSYHHHHDQNSDSYSTKNHDVAIVDYSMYNSLRNFVGSNSERRMGKERNFQRRRCCSFDSAKATRKNNKGESPQSLEAAKKYLLEIPTAFPL